MDGLITGKVVHYGVSCHAAMVTHVWTEDGLVNLYVLPDGVTRQEGATITSVPHRSQAQGLIYWHALDEEHPAELVDRRDPPGDAPAEDLQDQLPGV